MRDQLQPHHTQLSYVIKTMPADGITRISNPNSHDIDPLLRDYHDFSTGRLNNEMCVNPYIAHTALAFIF